MGKFLEKRAQNFEEEARELYKKEKYNIAAFLTEQALQLHMKNWIYKAKGEFPKIQQIHLLIDELGKACDQLETVREFHNRNNPTLSMIQSAFLQARNAPEDYEAESVQEMLDFLDEFKQFYREQLK